MPGVRAKASGVGANAAPALDSPQRRKGLCLQSSQSGLTVVLLVLCRFRSQRGSQSEHSLPCRSTALERALTFASASLFP